MSEATQTRPNAGVGYFLILIAVVLVVAWAVVPSSPPVAPPDEAALAEARAATGGAQTRESIMARQAGAEVDLSYRAEDTGVPGAAAGVPQLGALGGTSDSEIFRALRYSDADVTVSSQGPAADVLIQDGGMAWLEFREGPLITYGGGGLLLMLAVLVAFYAVRGKIRIDGPKTGQTILRFTGIERFAHWLLAVSFILLGITGIVALVGRKFLIPWMGHEAFSVIALGSKWIHNNVAWAFMLALVLVFVFWVWHNIPTWADVKWLAKGGGIFGGDHVPAKKFNAGQKIIFWAVIVLGVSISLSGIALLFPFELPMFAKTFKAMNDMGLPGMIGMDPLPVALLPHQEMQLSQAWHGIVAFIFMAIILAHIYLGSVGMEGAFDAMGKGEVEKQWAREHHSIWYESVTGEAANRTGPDTTPAE